MSIVIPLPLSQASVPHLKFDHYPAKKMELDGKKIVKYRITTKIRFDVEK